jgi:hypothetical protein
MSTRRGNKPSDAISYQVAIVGRGLDRMSHAAMREMVDRYVSGDMAPPDGVTIRIQCWRAGRELDFWSDNPRALVLRTTFRRLVQSGRIALALRGSEADYE